MSLKTIQMDPLHLKVSKQKKTKKTIVPPSVMIHQSNLRQMLLTKLMKHRKTQKGKETMIMNNNFDQQCSMSSPPESIPAQVYTHVSTEPISNGSIQNGSIQNGTIQNDKPYGVLKNGTKPTYKTWSHTQKMKENLDFDSVPSVPLDTSPVVPVPVPVPVVPVQVVPVVPAQVCQVDSIPVDSIPVQVSSVESTGSTDTFIETKKPVRIGRSKKHRSVHILIPCHHTRKLRSDTQEGLKKTNLTTVKNYLKSHKLIKVGSTAPTNLIREIYENAKSFGDVVNENKHNLLYNYEKDTDTDP